MFFEAKRPRGGATRQGKNLGDRVSGEDDGHRANAKEQEMGLMRDNKNRDSLNGNWTCSQR